MVIVCVVRIERMQLTMSRFLRLFDTRRSEPLGSTRRRFEEPVFNCLFGVIFVLYIYDQLLRTNNWPSKYPLFNSLFPPWSNVCLDGGSVAQRSLPIRSSFCPIFYCVLPFTFCFTGWQTLVIPSPLSPLFEEKKNPSFLVSVWWCFLFLGFDVHQDRMHSRDWKAEL